MSKIESSGYKMNNDPSSRSQKDGTKSSGRYDSFDLSLDTSVYASSDFTIQDKIRELNRFAYKNKNLIAPDSHINHVK